MLVKTTLMVAAIAVAGGQAFAMSDLEYLVEGPAIAKAIAIQAECGIEIDDDQLLAFISDHFADKEAQLLSMLDFEIEMAKDSFSDASALQKKVECSAAKSYFKGAGALK